MTKEELFFLFKKYRISPAKFRGQNFLLDETTLQNICQTAALHKGDLVLEVGPGLGALTKYLAQQAGQVVAWELDQSFRPALEKLRQLNGNIDIYWQDILSLSSEQWQKIMSSKNKNDYKVVANIPYYISAKLINKFVQLRPTPTSITLLLQKEVAQRVTDKEKSSLLSLSLAFYGEGRIIDYVSKEKFYPRPQVDSAILHIYQLRPWSYPLEERRLWQLVRRGFASKRKKLVNNLATDQNISKALAQEALLKMNLDTNIRAEDLSPGDWLNLGKYLFKVS